MEPITTICLNSPENIAALVGMIVTGASAVVNFVPSPDKIQNPILCAFSRALHFVAFDLTTAAKRK